jgi:hypothetical protein
VSGDATRLHVEITSIEQGDCPAMSAVEAIGMQLASSFAGATVEAAHLTEHFGADEEWLRARPSRGGPHRDAVVTVGRSTP